MYRGEGGSHQFKPLQGDATEVHWASLTDADKAGFQHRYSTQHMYPPTHTHNNVNSTLL